MMHEQKMEWILIPYYHVRLFYKKIFSIKSKKILLRILIEKDLMIRNYYK